ncbi:MAG TPA: methyltransferase [Candidatus Binataceae bacterium]|nr:methyltransferase [Candidatus Binataceae bacterium]
MAIQSQAAAGGSLPPPMLLHQMGTGHYLSRALGLAAKLCIADHLKNGPRHYSEVARETGTHPPSLNRVMRLLAGAGVLSEEENGCFALTPLGELLRSDVPGSMRAAVMLFAGEAVQTLWGELEYCVQTGQPAFKKNSPDATAFTGINQNPESAAAFDEAMAAFSTQTALALVAAYDFSAFAKVADIGGGNGALLIGILKGNPNLRGLVFDQPASAERAKRKIAESGLESRCEAASGDFFKEVPAGADVYLLKHVIHDWNDEDAVAILKTCHRAMSGTNAKLLIVEGIYPARIDQSLESRGSAFNDVNMLVCTGGRQRSEAEFRALYQAAGFKLTRIVPTAARVCVIEGVRI